VPATSNKRGRSAAIAVGAAVGVVAVLAVAGLIIFATTRGGHTQSPQDKAVADLMAKSPGLDRSTAVWAVQNQHGLELLVQRVTTTFDQVTTSATNQDVSGLTSECEDLSQEATAMGRFSDGAPSDWRDAQSEMAAAGSECLDGSYESAATHISNVGEDMTHLSKLFDGN
jgi:hypothetical protein